MPVRKQKSTEFGPVHVFIGLLLGFLLGTSLVYWHSNRQNDRIISETIDKVMTLFAGQTIQLLPGDSIIVVKDRIDAGDTVPVQPAVTPRATPARREDYQIAQDRLLNTRTIPITFTDTISEAVKRLDSLIGNLNPTPSEKYFLIEFWESPLNSVGYKMGKNKLVLFGIRAYDMVSILEHKGITYVRYINQFYPVEHTTSFKPLVPVIDPFVIDEHDFY